MLKIAASEFLGSTEVAALQASRTCHEYDEEGEIDFDVEDYIAKLLPRPHLKTLEPKSQPKGGNGKGRGLPNWLTESQQLKIKSNKEAALKIKALKAAASRSEGSDMSAVALESGITAEQRRLIEVNRQIAIHRKALKDETEEKEVQPFKKSAAA